MKWWHNTPLALFTLVMPGVVLGYYWNYTAGTGFLLMLSVISIFTLGLASFHLGRPLSAPVAIRHIHRSWLSREMLLFTLLVVGLVMQGLFAGLRVPGLTLALLLIGLAATGATIMVYHKLPACKGWPIWADILCGGAFIGCLLAGKPFLITFLIPRVMLDVSISLRFYRAQKQSFWLFSTLTALLTLILTLSFKTTVLTPLALLVTVSVRSAFLEYVEQPTLPQTAEELRKSYMAAEHQKYFSMKNE